MEGGRVIHSWCICVVSHSYGVLGGAGVEVMVGRHAGQIQEGLVACRKMPERIPSAR